MDGMILTSVIISFFLFALSLKYFYDYQMEKKALKEHIHEKVVSDRFDIQKRKTRKEQTLEKVFYYADDFSALGNRINFFSESHDVKRWLVQAGYPYSLTVERFQGLKIFLMLFGLIIGVLFMIIGFPFAHFFLLLFPIIGYFSAIYWLKGKATRRQDELGFSLPDFLDTVSVTLQAGLGLDQALRDIVPHFQGPIGEEFSRFNQEIDLGVPREQAYRRMLERNDNLAFQSLIKSLIQGSRLGVPVATTFKIQANEMRQMKKEKIKELAAKASPKVTLITSFIVMPTVMILIGGLLVLNMFTGEGGFLEMFG